uniref:SprB repeat-containing protein n=1 Tax=uncultured Caulobacter sp. TaxID=158749 RepID=UPI0025D51A15|nr:SprB repeat-containing protein [uncultured Caulobacter sp.]
MKSRRELMFSAAGLGVGALMVATAAQARTLSASASPSIVGLDDDSWSDPVTVSVSGGIGPYTYQWVRTSGSSDIDCTDPNSDVTQFRWLGAFGGPPRLSGWVCQVTDSANETTSTGLIRAAYASD